MGRRKIQKEDYIGKVYGEYKILDLNYDAKQAKWLCKVEGKDKKIKENVILHNLARCKNKECSPSSNEKGQYQNFRIKNLRSGMIVRTRNNQLFIVADEALIDLETGETKFSISGYKDNLKHFAIRQFDIVRVYNNYTLTNLLWRKPVYSLTDKEKEMLKAAKSFKLTAITRNSSDTLIFTSVKPYSKGGKEWIYQGNLSRVVVSDNRLFPFIKWEDEECYYVDDLMEGFSNEN